jgi:HK97 family phage portal protein
MAVVVSEGRLADVQPSWASSWAGSMNGSLGLYEGRWADYAAIWKTQPNVRFVVGFIARNVAQVGIKVYRRVSNTEREELSDHPASQVLRRPQPRPMKLTQYRILEHLTACLGIYDNAFWIKLQVGDRMALVPAPPWAMSVTGKNWIRPEGYTLTLGGREVPFDPDQVVHCHGFNPLDSRIGVSPMETLRRILAEEESAGQWREQFWQNSARHEAVVKRPADAPPWSDDARKRWQAEWTAWRTGTSSSGTTAVLEEGMDLVPMSWSAKDSQYLEARKLTRAEVAAAFYIWPAMVGIMEDSNYSVIAQVRPMLYTDSLGPTFQSIQQDLNLQLLPDFPDSDNIYCEFNIGEKLKGSFEEQSSFAQASVGAPWVTRNEQRARFNLPPVNGGDGLITPLNVLVGGQASPQDSAPPPKTVDPEAVKAVVAPFLDRQARVLSSRKGAGHPQWDAARWNAELEKDLRGILNGSALVAAEQINAATKAALDDGGDPFGPDRLASIGRIIQSQRMLQVEEVG